MKIIITGMPYFAKKIYKFLSDYDKSNTYLYLNTFYSYLDKIKYLINILSSDVIYIIGGAVNNSKVIDIALLLNKKIIMHWAGSDVLYAKKNIQDNKFNYKYIKNIVHLCEVNWIQEELKNIGIKAKVSPIMICENEYKEDYLLPKKFIVLSYIGKDRPKFYGIDTIYQLAIDFPDIEFRIAGLEYYKDAPKNIKFLGWTNMDEEYKKCVVYIRTPKHDGLAYSVLEALSYGRIVLRNYKFPNTIFFSNYNDLKNKLNKLIMEFEKDNLNINTEGIKYVRDNYNKTKVLNSLIKIFES